MQQACHPLTGGKAGTRQIYGGDLGGHAIPCPLQYWLELILAQLLLDFHIVFSIVNGIKDYTEYPVTVHPYYGIS